MRYADSACQYREEYTPEHVYVFTGPCIMSGKTVEVRVPAAGLYKYRQGAKIQEAFPDMSVADREFLMSGISGEAFDEAFSEDEDDSQLDQE